MGIAISAFGKCSTCDYRTTTLKLEKVDEEGVETWRCLGCGNTILDNLSGIRHKKVSKPAMASRKLKDFKKDRDEALLSLDKQKLLAYCKKYEIPLPEEESVFWTGIHRARLALKTLPKEEREKSLKHLREQGIETYEYEEKWYE